MLSSRFLTAKTQIRPQKPQEAKEDARRDFAAMPSCAKMKLSLALAGAETYSR
jgi:hypothetical protein